MQWVLWMIAVAVLGLAAVAASGRLGELPGTVTSTPRPHVPTGQLNGNDLRALRFAVVPRGYSMDQVDDLLDRLARQLDQAHTAELGGSGLPEDGTGSEPAVRPMPAAPWQAARHEAGHTAAARVSGGDVRLDSASAPAESDPHVQDGDGASERSGAAPLAGPWAPADENERARPADEYQRAQPADEHERARPTDEYERARPVDEYERTRPADQNGPAQPADNDASTEHVSPPAQGRGETAPRTIDGQ